MAGPSKFATSQQTHLNAKPRIDVILDCVAYGCFRDIADKDYIAARVASRLKLVEPYLWSSLQAIEKYIKCILLLKRISSKSVGHVLLKGLSLLEQHGVSLDLTEPTQNHISYLDRFGRFRYSEASNIANGHQLVALDRSVWELRRYCTRDEDSHTLSLRSGESPPRMNLSGGVIERVLQGENLELRRALVWQNGFFGQRRRRKVKLERWMIANNSPFFLFPEHTKEIEKFIYVSKDLVAAYEALGIERFKEVKSEDA